MIFANNLDPDEAPQNVGSHLISNLFDNKIIIAKDGNDAFFFTIFFLNFFFFLLSMQRFKFRYRMMTK